MNRRRWILALGVLVAWALLDCFLSLVKRAAGPLGLLVEMFLIAACVCGSILLWRDGLRAFGSGWRRLVLLGALALPLASLLTSSLDIVVGWRGAHAETFQPASMDAFQWADLLLVALALALAFHFLEQHRMEAERQRLLAVQARDAVLRARLAPHFIFNTLNTLHAQIEADPRRAQATTERLASLFRQVVEVAVHPTLPLRQELAFVEAYLGIERDRLGARLRVEIAVPEELEGVEIPPLSLQVLVENAVKHGIAPLEEGGRVCVTARQEPEGLRICVENEGVSRIQQGGTSRPQGRRRSPPAESDGTGSALETLRHRLARPEDLTLERWETGFRACFLWRTA